MMVRKALMVMGLVGSVASVQGAAMTAQEVLVGAGAAATFAGAVVFGKYLAAARLVRPFEELNKTQQIGSLRLREIQMRFATTIIEHSCTVIDKNATSEFQDRVGKEIDGVVIKVLNPQLLALLMKGKGFKMKFDLSQQEKNMLESFAKITPEEIDTMFQKLRAALAAKREEMLRNKK